MRQKAKKKKNISQNEGKIYRGWLQYIEKKEESTSGK